MGDDEQPRRRRRTGWDRPAESAASINPPVAIPSPVGTLQTDGLYTLFFAAFGSCVDEAYSCDL